MDDASVDLAIMADSLEKAAEPLWDEEEPPQDNIFLIMKDFEQKKVRADAVKQALRTECNLPTETWTTMVAATGGTAWMQMEAAATLWVNLLKLSVPAPCTFYVWNDLLIQNVDPTQPVPGS